MPRTPPPTTPASRPPPPPAAKPPSPSAGSPACAPPARVEDGRRLRIRFPGIPAPGYGPDARNAVIEIDGAELCGDVELHLRASGWRDHGHEHDPAYARVVLHVVEENDGDALVTMHGSGLAIPIAVAAPPAATAPLLPAFSPPCASATASPAAALEALGLERLRARASRAQHWAAARGPAPVLYALALETLASRPNREAFAELARRLPSLPSSKPPPPLTAPSLRKRRSALPPSLPSCGRPPTTCPSSATAAGPPPCPSAASRPSPRSAPASGPTPPPAGPRPSPPPPPSPAPCAPPASAPAPPLELAANAALPVALGSHLWPEDAALARYRTLRAPAPYGQLRPLSTWLRSDNTNPLASACALQGALQLHARYCSRGACGSCLISGSGSVVVD